MPFDAYAFIAGRKNIESPSGAGYMLSAKMIRSVDVIAAVLQIANLRSNCEVLIELIWLVEAFI